MGIYAKQRRQTRFKPEQKCWSAIFKRFNITHHSAYSVIQFLLYLFLVFMFSFTVDRRMRL